MEINDACALRLIDFATMLNYRTVYISVLIKTILIKVEGKRSLT